MKIKKAFALVAMAAGIGVMIYAQGLLARTRSVYREGDSAYRNLSAAVKIRSETGAAMQTMADGQGYAAELLTVNQTNNFPAFAIDFKALSSVNEEAAAWLYSPGTAIDYPVMKAGDYAYYLNHLPDGTVNANGSLFIDYNSNADFNDPLTVVYGHHMKSGSMFGSLKGYKEQSYYEEHPYMYLFTKQGNYRIDLLYGCVIGAGQWRERAFMYPENTGALLAYAARNTTFTSGAAYTEGDRVVALSTCSYDFENARYIVVGILNEVEQF